MSDFFKTYVGDTPTVQGVPGLTMNAPVRGTNSLQSIGLELEVEGRGLPNEGHLDGIVSPSGGSWTTHEDGSLRGESKEYVLDRPIKIEEVPDMINALYDKFTQLGTRLNLSNRCSTHVHKNITGLKVNQLTSIIALWTAFEEVLVNWCGEERKSNHFCLSAKDSDRNIILWDQFLRDGRRNFPEGVKYTALHVRSIWQIGSLEFRPMCASEDREDIIQWVKLVDGLCEYAKTNYNNPANIANEISERRGADIFEDICRSSGNSREFIDSVFAAEDNARFNDLVLDGLRRAQLICLGHPWHDWMPLIEKEYVPSPFSSEKKSSTRIARPRLGDIPEGWEQAVEDVFGQNQPARPRQELPRIFRGGEVVRAE